MNVCLNCLMLLGGLKERVCWTKSQMCFDDILAWDSLRRSTACLLGLLGGTGQLKCDGTGAETRFRLSAKRTSPFKSARGRQFSRLQAAEVCASVVVMLDTVAYRGGVGLGCSTPPPKFQRPSKIVSNSTRLRELLKIAEFRTPTHQDVRKKGSKIPKLPRFTIVLH